MKFTTNQVIGMVAGALVFLGIGYYAGMTYGHAAGGGYAMGQGAGAAGGAGFARGAYGAGGAGAAGGRTGFGGAGAGAGGAATTGTILSQTPTSITIATTGGGSRIVLVSASTTVMTVATSSVSGLSTGEAVTVLGTTNSDGSVSARSIQARE